MDLYDQVDTIPIYQSSLIILNIGSGAIILKEADMYTWWEFLIVCLCGVVAIIGVFLIVKKPTFQKYKVE